MEGGSREVTLDLTFKVDHPDSPKHFEWTTTGTFHDADIQVDAILSYPWLEESHLGVFPHLGSLVKLPPQGEPGGPILLKGWPKRKRKRCCGPRLDTQLHSNRPRRLYWSKRLADLARRCRDDEEHLANVTRMRAMQLQVPTEMGEKEDPLFEDEETLDFLATQVKETQPNAVWGVITVPEGQQAEDQSVKELIEAIHRDFDGTVLRENVPPENIIPRGPYGEGHIRIKQGYQAKKQRPIHLVGERREALIELVQDWMRDGKVENGRGEWSSPAFVVAKKGGKWRGVVDFRALNEATEADGYPLPRIEDMLVQYGTRSMFTVMDLKDAFHQVPMHPDSRPYTCTSTPIGTKQGCVVVMGLKNGVPIFQRVVEYSLEQ